MAYFDNIPLATEAPADTRPKFVQNFQAIKTLVGIDHKNFGDAQEGKHDKVTLPVRVMPPVGGAEVILYSATVSGDAHLFIRSLTKNIDIMDGSNTAQGWARLGTGLLVKWGNLITTPVSTVALNSFGPAFTAMPFWFCVSSNDTIVGGPTNYAFAAGTLQGVMPNPQLKVVTYTAGATAYWLVLGV